MILLVATVWVSVGMATPVPKVSLLYPAPAGSVFDRNCTETLKDAPVIDPKWVEEAVRRAPEFQKRWEEQGPAFVRTALDGVGTPFPYSEMQAAITVCPVPSMSLPLMINVRPFLSTATRRPPEWFFSFVVFHELMHTYTRAANTTSIIRRKYATETAVTLNHLHVLALEQFVLAKMGKNEELKWLDNYYRTVATPAYKRAWEIVNDSEGVERLLNELRAAK